MDKEITQQILSSGAELLTNIASAMQKTGEHVYMVFVRQQSISGIANLIGIFVFLFLEIIASYFYIKLLKKYEKEQDMADLLFALLCITAIILFPLSFYVTENIKLILNPEYYAIKEIIESVRGTK